jgi:prepilin signal peptidase PulO-like enzyme (type II secretory pathway)
MAKIELPLVNGVAVSLFVICIVAGIILTGAVHHPAPAIIGALAGLYFLFAIKVVQQWEKVALLRSGDMSDFAAPDCFILFPSSKRLARMWTSACALPTSRPNLR